MSAGAIDPTFGTQGYAAVTGLNFFDNSATIAVDAAGRELIGTTTGFRYSGATITRLTHAGAVDTTFGTDGTITITAANDPGFMGGEGIGQIIALANGNLLASVAGGTVELTTQGNLVTAFGVGGEIAGAGDIAVQADGKIVAVVDTAGSPYLLERFNPNGSLDTTFGTGGAAKVIPTAAGASIAGTVIDSAGRAVVSVVQVSGSRSTSTDVPTSATTSVERFTTAGVPDATFGTAGVVTTATESDPDGVILSPGTVAIAPDGTLYQTVVYTPYNGTQFGDSNLALWAISPDGKHIAGGAVASYASVGQPEAAALAVGSDGKPIVAEADRVDRLLPINPATGEGPAFDPSFAASGSVVPPDPAPFFDGATLSYDAYTVTGLALDGGGNLLVGSDSASAESVSRILTAGPSSVVPVAATGTVIGTAGSYQNQGNTVAKAFDGNLNTFVDAAAASGSWAGLDLGTAAGAIVQIQYAPRAGWASRMVGGQFQVSSTADFSSDVHTIYTVTSTPVVGSLTTVAVGDAGGPYRYVRYLGPTGGYGNIAELKVLVAGPSVLTGTVIGTAGSYANQGNTIANAFDGNPNTFVDAATASGSWAGLDLGSARSVSQISFAPRAGWAARMVGGQFQASNTADFSSGVVTLYTVTTAPTVGQLTTVTVNAAAGVGFRYVRYIGPTGGYGNIAEADFFSGPPVTQAGTVIGTAGSYNNQGNTIANAVDGNLNTFFDGPDANGDYVGVDLGTAVAITSITVAPRAGFASRMVGGSIVASNELALTPGSSLGTTTIYTFTSAPPAGVLTTIALSNTTAYRYWYYVGPNGSYCNIAELAFDA